MIATSSAPMSSSESKSKRTSWRSSSRRQNRDGLAEEHTGRHQATKPARGKQTALFSLFPGRKRRQNDGARSSCQNPQRPRILALFVLRPAPSSSRQSPVVNAGSVKSSRAPSPMSSRSPRARNAASARSTCDDLSRLSRTRSGQGGDRRSAAARDWSCPSLPCPGRVVASVSDARPHESSVRVNFT